MFLVAVVVDFSLVLVTVALPEFVEVTLIFLVFELELEPLGVLRMTIVDFVPMPVYMWFWAWPLDRVFKYICELSDFPWCELRLILDEPMEDELLTDWAVVPLRAWLLPVALTFSLAFRPPLMWWDPEADVPDMCPSDWTDCFWLFKEFRIRPVFEYGLFEAFVELPS